MLATKLFVPQARPALVARPRLMRRLDAALHSKLALVSASAGFGKTTVLSQWIAASRAPGGVAWVSLDEGDNDTNRFWSYVIAALRTVRPGAGETALSLLSSIESPPIEQVLTALINDINAVEHHFVLVLDDYHVLEAQAVHHSVAFLLDHLPSRMHLVIATRSDPPLPLSRLRGRGELIELRASELRFNPDEAAAFFDEAKGLDLTAEDVAALETRTEGWIAGLQLAALSMRDRDDIPGFIRTFAGDDRYIVDYLVEEVLRLQPRHVRRFLLQTSVLDRLSGPLCEAVTGQPDSKGLLDMLERSNLFVAPLDDKRHWYRYHHLFADVLRAHAGEDMADQIPDLHRRASRWYERNSLPAEAIHHALVGKDFGRAAGMVELAGRAMLASRSRRDESIQDSRFLAWLKALPEEVVTARPVLSVYYALALLSGDLDSAEARLRDAELVLDLRSHANGKKAGQPSEKVVANEDDFRSLPGIIAIVRAYLAGARDDVRGLTEQAQRAADLLPESEHLWRGAVDSLLSLAYWASGDLEAAYRRHEDGLSRLRMTGDITYEIRGALMRGDIRAAQGRLSEAASIYEQALQLATSRDGPALMGAADLYVGTSEIYVERNDLEAALCYLQLSKDLGEPSMPEVRYRWYTSMARVKEAQGDLDGALDLLGEAERRYIKSPGPNVRPVAALRTRVWLKQGRLAEAMVWVRESGISVDDVLSYAREFEHITLTRALVARSRCNRADSSLREAISLLERLRPPAEEGGRIGRLIEMLLLQALANEASSDIPGALAALERALILAEPEGYARIFVDEGPVMRTLLRHAAARGIASSYTQRLLAAFDGPVPSGSNLAPTASSGLAEPLTPREIEVLRLVKAGMRNQEIAGQLFISLSTIKRHIANAYGKLGARHRTEAVARATELHLL